MASTTLRTLLSQCLAFGNRCLKRFGFQVIRENASLDLYWSDINDDALRYSKLLPSACYSPWLSDNEFLDVYRAIKSHTLVDIYRCFELWDLARQARNISGDFLEVGVWRGGTACLLAKAAERAGKTIFLADTFEGVVKAGADDSWYKDGEHADTSRQIVESLLQSIGACNTKIIVGVFPDETSKFIPNKIALLHVDVDVYASARDILVWAIPRLSNGSIVIFDDYGFDRCAGITRLVNELRSTEDFLFTYNLNGHAILIKRN
jgi:O-methyltransferase